jgi:hypothetical protein
LKWGIEASLTCLVVILNFIIYLRIKRTEINSTFTRYSFNIASSLLFAFTNFLFYFSLFKTFDIYGNNVNTSVVDAIIVIVHVCIFCTTTVLVVYFKDIYYGLFMFLYQLGLTLGKEVREETVSLVLTIITGLVIVFSVLMLFKKQEKDNAKEIEKTYQEENRDMLLTPSVSLSPKK